MKRKGFTLIELLAVIIILGILMLIAIPSVTNYINSSRKKTYVNTANELVKAASTKIASGDIEITDTDTTYYIDVELLDLENGKAKSPYGDFEPAYVVVTYDGEEYNYYWTSRDKTGQGVKDIVPTSSLNETNIVSNIGADDIKTNVGIGSRSKIKVIKKDGTVTDGAADYNVAESGGNRIDGPANIVCKRASTLHGFNCTSNNQCSYYYGNDPSTRTSGVLEDGDAFDCDVNNDGTYDPNTERFYYMRECIINEDRYHDCASLIYYTNVKDGEPVSSITSSDATYWENGIDDLPTSAQWSNPGLILFGNRKLYGYNGQSTDQQIDYNNKPARYPALFDALFEYYYNRNDYLSESASAEDTGYWVEAYDCPETGMTGSGNGSFYISRDSYTQNLFFGYDYTTDSDKELGVRPVINVMLRNMEY